jgi:hypothetical protein
VARRRHRDDPSGQGVGTTYRRIVAGRGGRRVDADVEITEIVADERIAFRTTKARSAPPDATSSTPAMAVVTFRLAAKLRGVKKLMAPMLAKTMKSEVAALTELKRVLESRAWHRQQPVTP